MIITRTPFRISFFGGGTDYPVWFNEHAGAVLATTINKYCYVSVRYLPPFFDHKSRIVWSKIELVKTYQEIQHPAVQAVIKYLNVERGISLHHDGDLPARSGLGSSSTFTVALLHALYGLEGRMIDKRKLADDAIHIEQKMIKDHVGCQDQILAAYGGLNRIDFAGENHYQVMPLTLPREKLEIFQDHLMLFFTGVSRTASEIAKEQVETTRKKGEELKTMYQMVDEGMNILKEGRDLSDFGRLLHEGWVVKRGLTSKITNPFIDELYDTAIRAGAIGGKILGAGGGGFLLLFAKPEFHSGIKQALNKLLCVPFRFENAGSQIIYYEPDGYPV